LLARFLLLDKAVRAHVFHRTVEAIKACNVDSDQGELQTLIDNAVRDVRAKRRAKAKADKA
jgi:hypothetical protein